MGQTIEEIRRQNARQLAGEIGGQAEFARRIGKSRQLVNHYIGKNPIRSIGSNMARKIEAALKISRGWMDEFHGSGAFQDNSQFQTSSRPIVPSALAEEVDSLISYYLVASPTERRAILQRAQRAAGRATTIPKD